VKNPATGDYFKAGDFEIGKVVTIYKILFLISKATEYAMFYIEAGPNAFNQFDLGRMTSPLLRNLSSTFGYEISKHQSTTILRRYQADAEDNKFTLRKFLQMVQ
jgi:Ca2+-binding EF-hand superfamily protein